MTTRTARPPSSRCATVMSRSSLPTAGTRVGIEGRDQLGTANLVSPGRMGRPRRAVVGRGLEIRPRGPAPDVHRRAGVAAAVGVEEGAGRRGSVPEDHVRGVEGGLIGERRPAGRLQPGRLVELTMRGRAQIVSFALVAAEVRGGVGAGDDRLHLEHPLDVARIAGWRGEFRQDCGAHVVLERHPDHRRASRRLHPDEPQRRRRGQVDGQRPDVAAPAGQQAGDEREDTRPQRHIGFIGRWEC